MSFLNRPAFECDVWSRLLGCGCEFYTDFWVEEDKCWLRVFSPYCQEIIATYALVGFVWYRLYFIC
jgi:hypothetical protein